MTFPNNKMFKELKLGETYHGEYKADGMRIFSPSQITKTENGHSMSMKAPVLTVSDFFENPEGLAVAFAKLLNTAEKRPYVEQSQ